MTCHAPVQIHHKFVVFPLRQLLEGDAHRVANAAQLAQPPIRIDMLILGEEDEADLGLVNLRQGCIPHDRTAAQQFRNHFSDRRDDTVYHCCH